MKRIDKLISIRKLFEIKEKEVARNLYRLYQIQKQRQDQIDELVRYRNEYTQAQVTSSSRILMQRSMLGKLERAIEYGQQQARQFDHRLEGAVTELARARSKHKAISRLIEKIEQQQNLKEQLNEQQEVESFLLNQLHR